MIIKAAFATDDGYNFMGRHFGDAEFFDIYEINEKSFNFVKRISNSTEEEEEEIHADPKKAKSISKILLEQKINTAVSRIFGPNIKRIRKKFVCLILDDIKIEEAIKRIQENYNEIEAEWLKGEERSHISLRGKVSN